MLKWSDYTRKDWEWSQSKQNPYYSVPSFFWVKLQNELPQPVSKVINWHCQEGCADRTSTISCLHTASDHPFLSYRNSSIGSRLGACNLRLPSFSSSTALPKRIAAIFNAHTQKLNLRFKTATTKWPARKTQQIKPAIWLVEGHLTALKRFYRIICNNLYTLIIHTPPFSGKRC